jgi:heterodisulfide reductase subunit C
MTAAASTPTLAGRLEREAQVRVAECYQCGKCSAGCPVAGEMDVAPSRILRMLQLELPQHEGPILRALTLWLCVGCETCLTRCPQEVDLPRTMDFLRKEALARGIAHREARDVIAFHRAFLHSVEWVGRLFELGMIGEYKLRTGHLLQDMTQAPAMFVRGKVGLLPHGRAKVAQIFQRVRTAEKEEETKRAAAAHADEQRASGRPR